jgi:excisionase family DNA binding protein
MPGKILDLPQHTAHQEKTTNENFPNDGILTLEETACFLKVKKRMLYDRVQRNNIPHLRVGKLIRFSKTALLDWMAQEAAARH